MPNVGFSVTAAEYKTLKIVAARGHRSIKHQILWMFEAEELADQRSLPPPPKPEKVKPWKFTQGMFEHLRRHYYGQGDGKTPSNNARDMLKDNPAEYWRLWDLNPLPVLKTSWGPGLDIFKDDPDRAYAEWLKEQRELYPPE